MCKVLEVSRSGYYKWKEAQVSPQAARKALLLQRITYHFKDTQGRYGSPKITILLQREGHQVSERTVGKYMQELGLRSCVAKQFRVNTTDSNQVTGCTKSAEPAICYGQTEPDLGDRHYLHSLPRGPDVPGQRTRPVHPGNRRLEAE
ncbi:hypothetical protein B9T62_38330 [Paenibacillus donghaensis]|uniref:HTH-like domain-containing protein n=1 Tax=Paenibacillus donghaensis TaxID=414771 RepID=A0A2Z2KST6_9BACL|nr:hypothetical protein B9T62_38330 [Paenibacillus donghaensis]